MYRSLDPDAIHQTIERLHRRISERFPASGLAAVAGELLRVAGETQSDIERIRRPHRPLRIAVGTLIAAIIAALVLTFREIDFAGEPMGLTGFVALTEAAMNELVLIGALIFFLVTIERRWRRTRCLRAIHVLRSLAHVVDMHQLTKDPRHLAEPAGDTPSSPKRTLSSFELSRYLDYCSEMFSLIAKLGALYLQSFDDATVIASVNDVDQLTTGLSRKVWQKIMSLPASRGAGPARPGR